MPRKKSMNEAAAIVHTSQKDFSDAIKAFAGLNAKQHPEEAVVYWVDEHLYISLPGMSVGFPVSGTWPITARVPAYFVIWHAQNIPRGDQIEIGVKDGRFSINGARVKCNFQMPDSTQIELPMEPSLKQLATVHLNFDAASIESAGLTPLVDDAWQQALNRVSLAAKHLHPLGVSEKALLQYVESVLGKAENQ